MKLCAIIFAIGAVSMAAPLVAAPKKKPAEPKPAPESTTPPKPEEPKKTTYLLKGEVVAVSASSLTLKGVEGQPDKKYAFTENTKILNDDKTARLTDIKPGNKISAIAKKAYKGEDQVLTLNVGTKLDLSDEKKPDAKKPDKPKPAKKKPVT